MERLTSSLGKFYGQYRYLRKQYDWSQVLQDISEKVISFDLLV